MPKYVNADALLFQMINRFHYLHGRKADPICIIEDAPAADVEPIKHGQWIQVKVINPMFLYGYCSLCGFEQSLSNKLKYCPNCGAKMEKNKND